MAVEAAAAVAATARGVRGARAEAGAAAVTLPAARPPVSRAPPTRVLFDRTPDQQTPLRISQVSTRTP